MTLAWLQAFSLGVRYQPGVMAPGQEHLINLMVHPLDSLEDVELNVTFKMRS